MQLSQGPAYQVSSSFLTSRVHPHMNHDKLYDLKGIGYNLEAIRGFKFISQRKIIPRQGMMFWYSLKSMVLRCRCNFIVKIH
jgi:hypothetical protein